MFQARFLSFLPPAARLPVAAGLAVFVVAVLTTQLALRLQAAAADTQFQRLGEVYLDGLAAAVRGALERATAPTWRPASGAPSPSARASPSAASSPSPPTASFWRPSPTRTSAPACRRRPAWSSRDRFRTRGGMDRATVRRRAQRPARGGPRHPRDGDPAAAARHRPPAARYRARRGLRHAGLSRPGLDGAAARDGAGPAGAGDRRPPSRSRRRWRHRPTARRRD